MIKRFLCAFFCSLIKPEKYSGNRRGAYASEISTIGSENQVKTYMDSSNGVRNASSNAYNKVRASAISLVFLLSYTILIQGSMLESELVCYYCYHYDLCHHHFSLLAHIGTNLNQKLTC